MMTHENRTIHSANVSVHSFLTLREREQQYRVQLPMKGEPKSTDEMTMAGPPDEMEEKHAYNDYANEADEAPETTEQLNHHEDNFPVKLHYMIKELETDGMADIVSWQPHGRCFLVHKQRHFVEKVLPLWFRQSKFPSFQRQLNLYGFKRLTSGRDKGGYYHERFLRSKPSLSHHIQRTKIKGKGPRKPSCPMAEPDFYSAPYLPHAGGNHGGPSFDSMRPSGPGMNPASSISLRRLIGAPQHAAASLHHYQQAPMPGSAYEQLQITLQAHQAHLEHQAHQAQAHQAQAHQAQAHQAQAHQAQTHQAQAHQAHLEHLRMVTLYQTMQQGQNTQGLPSFGQQSAPTLPSFGQQSAPTLPSFGQQSVPMSYGRPGDPNMTMAAANPAAFAPPGFWNGA